MASVAKLIVKIGANVSEATNALKGFAAEANASMKRAEAGSQALAVGIGAVGAAVAAFAVSAVKDLANVERINAQTAAALKSTGAAAWTSVDQINSLAQALENMSGIEAESIQTGENLLLTFTNIKDGVGAGNDVFTQATKIMVDMSVAMGTDAASGAIQLGKALNDPKQGITALTRVGVSFTEQQKKQIEALVEQGKTMEAQKIILAELNKEFGGSAAAAGNTAIGIWNKMTNALGDIGEAALTDAMPAIKDFGREITAEFRTVAAEIKRVGIAETLEGIVAPTDAAKAAVVALGGAIAMSLVPSIGVAAKEVWKLTASLGPWALAGAAAAIVAYDLYQIWKLWPEILTTVSSNWNLAKANIQGAVAAIELKVKVGMAAATQYVGDMVNGVKAWLGAKFKAAMDLATHPIESAKKAFFGLYDAVVGHSYIPDMVKETGQHMAKLDKHLAEPAERHTKAAKSAFQRMRDDIAKVMGEMSAKIGEASVEFKVTGDASALLASKIDATRDALRGLFKKGLDEGAGAVQAMRNELGLLIEKQDAAKVALEDVKAYETYAGALRGIAVQEQLWGTSQDTIAGKITATETAMAALADRFGPASEQVAAMREQWQAFNDQLTDQAVSDAVDGVFGKIATGATDAKKAMEGMSPMVKGINEALGTTSITAGHVQSALGALTGSFGTWSKGVMDELVKTGKMAKDEADRLQSRVTDSMAALDAVGSRLAQGDIMGTAVAMVFHGVKAMWNLFGDFFKWVGDAWNWIASGFQSKPPDTAAVPAATVAPSSAGFATKGLTSDMGGSGGGGGQIVINITGNTLMNDQDADRLGRLLVDTLRRQGVRFA